MSVFNSVKNPRPGKKELRLMSDMKRTNRDEHDADLHSIEEICSTTWEKIYRFIYYKVQNREEAEDITQETYVKAIPFLQRRSVHPDKYNGYLKTVAMNILRDLWRKKKRRGTHVNLDIINPLEHAMDDATEISAQRMVIEQALHQLKDEQRTVIELRILKGFSVADTAKLMDQTDANIRVIQYRALQKLSEILSAQEDGGIN